MSLVFHHTIQPWTFRKRFSLKTSNLDKAKKSRDKLYKSYPITHKPRYTEFRKETEIGENYYWNKIYKHSLYFLRSEGIYIPPSERKNVLSFTISLDSKTRPIKQITPNVRNGVELITNIINPSKVPLKIGWHISPDSFDRAFTIGSIIKIPESRRSSVVAHELAHAIENNNPDILKATSKFLYHRTKFEELVDLYQLGCASVENKEFCLKDKWKEKGGEHYCGRIYFSQENYSTKISEKDFIKLVHGDNEIFSMGIERLLENPIDFKKMDIDYFEFIINQIK